LADELAVNSSMSSIKMFNDRADAGRQLAQRLQHYRNRPDVVVLALPRGGVPVAAEVADALHLPLDVLVVRKLGAPDQPELAMGAIAAGGAVVINPTVQAFYADQPERIAEVTQREQEELIRREHAYRGSRPPLVMRGRTAILVDDGAATGATMRAAVQALRQLHAASIVVALPVCSDDAEQSLHAVADSLVCLAVPQAFYAVGQWYREFQQTTDQEVQRILRGR
jgi:putative phosphoribosyl transferase